MELLSYGPFLTRQQAQEKGLRHYFTGTPCGRGHVAPRSVSCRRCCGCAAEASANRRAADPEAAKTEHRLMEARRAARKEADPAFREHERQRHNRASKTYRDTHPERVLRANRNWEQKPEVKPKRQAACRQRQQTPEVRAYRRKWMRHQRRTNPQYRLRMNLSRRMLDALEKGGAMKSASTQELLGCTFEQARQHLERQFQPGMTWENQGQWEVDHIRPCASFDLTDPAQQRECFHYSNLQPLWAANNRSKSDSGWRVSQRSG